MLLVEQLPRQPLPAGCPPMLVAVGPNTTDYPTIETVEEYPDVSAFVILAPTPQEWIKLHNRAAWFSGVTSAESVPALDP
jgi:hypothetical protein